MELVFRSDIQASYAFIVFISSAVFYADKKTHSFHTIVIDGETMPTTNDYYYFRNNIFALVVAWATWCVILTSGCVVKITNSIRKMYQQFVAVPLCGLLRYAHTICHVSSSVLRCRHRPMYDGANKIYRKWKRNNARQTSSKYPREIKEYICFCRSCLAAVRFCFQHKQFHWFVVWCIESVFHSVLCYSKLETEVFELLLQLNKNEISFIFNAFSLYYSKIQFKWISFDLTWMGCSSVRFVERIHFTISLCDCLATAFDEQYQIQIALSVNTRKPNATNYKWNFASNSNECKWECCWSSV